MLAMVMATLFWPLSDRMLPWTDFMVTQALLTSDYLLQSRSVFLLLTNYRPVFTSGAVVCSHEAEL